MIIGDPLYLLLIIPFALAANMIPAGAPRALVILLCSYAYYCTFSIAHLWVLLLVTAIAFAGGLLLEASTKSPWRNWLTGVLIAACFCPLLIYKYLLPLLASSYHTETHWPSTGPELLVPIGLSFYTFAAVGYLADVRLGVVSAERLPTRVALFCAFFPIVTAGPIPRTTTVLPQLEFTRQFSGKRGVVGITEILTGALMKLLMADRLGATSAVVFSDLPHSPPLEQAVATVLFAFQLYADFAGYSLIAIGSARLLGVDIPPNFRQPFLAPSIPEFWRRWHISLLGWLRDYVYMPLNLAWRKRLHPVVASAVAMFVTLVLVGIWHGAAWGFVLFGVVHGLLLIYGMTLPARSRLWSRLRVRPALVAALRVPVTFLVVALSLILVRAPNADAALQVYSSIFSFRMIENIHSLFWGIPDPALAFRHIGPAGLVDLVLVAALISGDLFAQSSKADFFKLPAAARAAFYALCLIAIVYQATSASAPKPFIYFQF